MTTQSRHLSIDRSADLNTFFAQLFKHFAQRPAFGHMGATISYGQLDQLSSRFAAWLQHHTDLQPGDRIAIQLPNLMQYPVVLIGALRAGLVVVNTNPLYTPSELESQFVDSGAKALVVFAPLAHLSGSILHKTSINTVILTEIGDLHPPVKGCLLNLVLRYWKMRAPAHRIEKTIRLRDILKPHSAPDMREVRCAPQDLALLQYTGGTTGPAKGAMLSHGNLLANLDQLRQLLLEYTHPGEERLLQPLPLYHIYAFMLTLALTAIGSRTELVPNPRDIKRLIATFKSCKPTVFAGINPLFSALISQPRFYELDLKELRITISGGMALTHALARSWHKLTGCVIAEGYGLTECSPVVSVNLPDAVRVGTVGPLLPETQVAIRDGQGDDLPVGEVGEIWIKGPQVMTGYWQHPEETALVLTPDGWLDTGDIGVLDKDGYLKIIDRRKEVINVSGFNVYPTELEDIISSHPDIEDCAVIGLPDAHTGEQIKLFVVPIRPGLTPQIVRDYCRERLTAYKVPKSVEFCVSLPRSPVGKVLRRVLREQVLNRHARSVHEADKHSY